MTLKEKFEPFTYFSEGNNSMERQYQREDNAIGCEQIADDYAIEFAQWLSENQRTKLQCKSYCKKHTMWFTDKKGYGATTKELLETFKKVNGL